MICSRLSKLEVAKLYTSKYVTECYILPLANLPKTANTAKMNNLYAWVGYKNFGDELSFYLVQKITGKKFVLQKPPFLNKTLLAIGSILKPITLSANSVIWGAGTLSSSSLDEPCHKIKIFPISRFIRQIRSSFVPKQPDIRAVRGPKTRELFLKKGIPCPEVYGDPAILLPRYYVANRSKNKYKAGLILHHSQTMGIPTSALKAIGILPISIFREGNQEIEQFINEVCSCEKIFSSSLHGIIVAQAYGVPAQWIQLERQPILDDDAHKFEDYFLGANQTVQKPLRIPPLSRRFTDSSIKHGTINQLVRIGRRATKGFSIRRIFLSSAT